MISSEYLVTVCVVVPKQGYKEWEGSYWKLADFVVPESSKRILEEGDQALYTVTMFRKTLDAFKNNAREKKFVVRLVGWWPGVCFGIDGILFICVCFFKNFCYLTFTTHGRF